MAENTQASVQDYFVIKNHILSTRTADAYNAVDKSRNRNICLWLLRHPFKIGSESARRFLGRMATISESQPVVCKLTGYGVDVGGVGFAVLEPLDGVNAVEGNFGQNESERRFMECVRLVAALHSHGVVCGDLCGSSFWMRRASDIELIGVMGSFDHEATETAMMPPVETFHYLSPEQRSGGAPEQGSDVFALGVLGYYYLTRKYPLGDQALAVARESVNKIIPPSSLIESPPVWADQVLMKCLSFESAKRFRSAGEMLQAIDEIRQRTMAAENVPVKQGARTTNLTAASEKLSAVVKHNSATEVVVSKSNWLAVIRKKPRVSLLLVFGLVLLVVVLGGLLHGSRKAADGKIQRDLEPHSYVASQEVKQALSGVANEGASFAERAAALDKIAASNDPVAYNALVTLAVDAQNESFRKLCEKSVVDRARRLGLVRAAEITKRWLDRISGPIPEVYSAVLRSLDVTLPLSARSVSVRQAYAGDPVMALKISAAMALDSKQVDEYQALLSQLVGDYLKLEDSSEHSVLALILAEDQLAQLFSDDVAQRIDQLPDGDVLWILQRLGVRGDINIRPIANLAVQRNLVSAVKAVHLYTLRDRDNLPLDVLQALIRAAGGQLKVEDIGAFGRWYDVATEKILFAICADESDPNILTEAFDTLAAKTLTSELGSNLIEWVRREHWDERINFIKAVGVLVNADMVEKQAIADAVQVFEPYVSDTSLVDILLDSSQYLIVKAVVERYSRSLGLGRLLSLLKNPDKAVRTTAVAALKSYNDVSALKIVIDAYESEKDEEVRQAYKDSFWFIKQRESK